MSGRFEWCDEYKPGDHAIVDGHGEAVLIDKTWHWINGAGWTTIPLSVEPVTSRAARPVSEAALAEALAEHVRGDWSDRTYTCQGCAERYEREAQARFDALGREPTREELTEYRNGYSKVSHPEWTLAEYNRHVAAVLARLGGVTDE